MNKVDRFFNEIRNMYIRDSKLDLNYNDIRRILRLYGIRKDDSKYNEIDDMLYKAEKYSKHKGVKVSVGTQEGRDTTYKHLLFNGRGRQDSSNIIKVYVPINYANMPVVLEKIYLYIINNNLWCETKVSLQDSSDNMVIRFCDMRDVGQFIEFCRTNSEISHNLRETNPFVATSSSLGVVQDTGINESFNSSLARALSDYLRVLNESNMLNSMGTVDFMNYLSTVINLERNKELKLNYLYIFKSLMCIENNLDPVSEIIKDRNSSLRAKHY